MRALQQKLWRDLGRLKAQALAIALVISSGVAVLVMSLSTLHSLQTTQKVYYQHSRFADIFVHLKRAPMDLVDRLKVLEGVKVIEPRINAYVNLQVKGFDEPVLGSLLSLPDIGEAKLNKPYLRKGRWLEPFRDDEVILSEAFANAHHLNLGDHISAVINGRYKALIIVGIALSPEHIYQIPPGGIFPDYKRYGVMWMAMTPFATAYDLKGAFNDLLIQIQPKADPNQVIEQVDRLLKRYGGQGAYVRDDQLSHRFLSEELKQLKVMALLFPVIFFGVAAFLLNIVIHRIITIQRGQIAVLKAFGYNNKQIGAHYLSLVVLITLFGIVLGVGIGVWFGRGLSKIYADFYQFPYFYYALQAQEVIIASLISLSVACLGAWLAVRHAVLLAPAQAMRPPMPYVFKETWLERFIGRHWFMPATRMILRNILRKPIKTAITVLGIALACGILMVGTFQKASIDEIVQVQYGHSQRQNLNVTLLEPASKKVMYALSGVKGVLYSEGTRLVPVKIHAQHRTYKTSLQGFPKDTQLERLLDKNLKPIRLPEKGILLTDFLGHLLKVKAGDIVQLEILSGHQKTVDVPVIGFSKQYLGLSAYASLDYVNDLMEEGPAINQISLRTDSFYNSTLYTKLQEMPRVVNINIRENLLRSFYETLGETILVFTFIISVLGGIMSFGIIYNNARIALAERIHELATLRILGFTVSEITYILMGELWLLTLIGIPMGFLVGYGLCAYLSASLQTDLYRVPLIILKQTYAYAALITLISTMISSGIIIRHLFQLDMVSALKARE